MTKALDLLPVLEKVNGTAILAVGEVMLDRFIYGDVTRISPEAPIPVLSVRRRTAGAGGVGNVAANLSGLGCRVALVSVAGDDAPRQALSDILAGLPGVTATLITDAGRPTIQKDRFIAGSQQMLRVDDESTNALSPATEDALIAACEKQFKAVRAIIVSDYGKGVITPRLMAALVKSGLPVYVDPKGFDYSKYKGAALITPNRKELGEATNMPTASDAEVTAAAQALMQKAQVQSVLATRSADGMTLVQSGADPVHLRTQAREVFDVSGAGDTVIATVAAVLASCADALSAAALANIAGGLVVEKVGTAAIRADDIRRFITDSGAHVDVLREGRGGGTIAPVLSWDEAREQVERWRARGQTVGFTNGCFDLVHQGHVRMLDRARSHCDRLVLGLNCDDSVTRLKGPTRPVNHESARASVIAALGSVDAVVLFGADPAEKDTPLDLIKALKPDMLFKGADYTADTVVGGDVVTAYGGRVVLVPLEEGFSTTGTIKKLGAA
jgi:D-beta-D-heptose 7-phosphate kinase/D-beta-D-heptose 1-phosphate adenosyltransferase